MPSFSADSLALPLSYRCSTRPKTSGRNRLFASYSAHDCPPSHASEVSKERFLEGNDYSCRWPLSGQVRTTVSTAQYRCMRLHARPSAYCLTRSLVIESSLPSSTFSVFSPSFSLRWSDTNGALLHCVLQIFNWCPAAQLQAPPAPMVIPQLAQ